MHNKNGLIAGQIVGIITVVVIIIVVAILQLTGKINILVNQRDFCPGIGDQVLCGICNKDIKLSNNPYAGQCRMCPAGMMCSGDVCGEIKCISNNSKVNKTLIPLQNVTYISKSGEQRVAKFAFPGYVYILTENISEADAVKDFGSNGGKIYSSIPDAGIYLVQVKEGTEGKFLSEIYKKEYVIEGIPVSPPTKGTISVYDFFSDRSAFASKPKWDCDKDHGNIVAKLASRYSAPMEIDELPLEIETNPDFVIKMIDRMKARIIKANKNCENIVFSLSLQSYVSGMTYTKIHSGCTGWFECDNVKEGQKIFYTLFLKMMDGLYRKNPTNLDHVILVIIAGNAGVDIDAPINAVRNKYPEPFNHMLIVGGESWNSEEIELDFNHLRNNTLPGTSLHPSMVYALAIEVPVLDENRQSKVECAGTSFAAPQVAAAVDYIWRKTPELTAKQVMDSFDRAMYDLGNAGLIPRKRKGIDVFIDPAFLDYAVKISTAKIPPTSLTGLWEGDLASKRISEEAWTCIKDTENPINICIQQQCKNVHGVITFPEGLKETTYSPEEGAFCPPSPSIPCKGGEGDYCSEFIGTFDGEKIKFDYFVVIGESYLPSPYYTDKVESSAIFVDNRIIFNFNSSGSSGAHSSSLTTGSFTTTKIENNCS